MGSFRNGETLLPRRANHAWEPKGLPSTQSVVAWKATRNWRASSALEHGYTQRYMDADKRIFQHHQGLREGPLLCPSRSTNLDVEDLCGVRTREIKAGTFYQIIFRWFVNKMQTGGLDVRQRPKRTGDLDLIRHYPAFEVTSLCAFSTWHRSTLAASSLARMK